MGAWIETYAKHVALGLDFVAPRVGAWIETSTVLLLILFLEGRTPCGCVD